METNKNSEMILTNVERVVGGIEWLAERIVIISFAVMVIADLTSVFTRNINFPVTWLEELARYMQIWFVGLGFALALRKGLLAGSEMLLKILPDTISYWLIILCKIGMLVISVLFLVSGSHLIEHLISTGQESPNMRFPIVYVYMGIYSGFILSIIFLLSSLLSNFFGKADNLDRTFKAVDKLMEDPISPNQLKSEKSS